MNYWRNINRVRTLGSIAAPDAGKSSRCPIRFRRLMASAVARPSTTGKLRERLHVDRPLFVRDVRDAIVRLILSRVPAAAIPPAHDLPYLQD